MTNGEVIDPPGEITLKKIVLTQEQQKKERKNN